jgi:WD40 repeat protein
MNRYLKFFALFSIFFLVSCTAKPAIRLNAGGVEMDLTREAPLGSAASLSSDGRYLLTKSFNDNFVRLWDVSTGTQISVMPVNSSLPQQSPFPPTEEEF